MRTLKQLSRTVQSEAAILLLASFMARAAFGQASITNIPSLGGSVMSATAMNKAGQVVGFSRTAGDAGQHAFLFSGGVLYDLGTLGGTVSLARDINTAGQIIGEASTTGDLESHVFLVTGGTTVDLDALGGTMSSSVAINDAGQVVGNTQTSGGQAAFLYSGGPALNFLGTLGGSFSAAAALNKQGQVVGLSSTTNDVEEHAFVFSGGVLYDLGTFGGGYSSAVSINDAGQVVGESAMPNFDTHAFLFSNGTLFDLGTLGGTYSTAYAINNSGDIIGDASTANDLQDHAFIFQNGTMHDLGTLGGDFSTASAMNNLGQVVGNADDTNFQSVPFLWQNGAMVDLNSLLPPNSGWQLQAASLINDAGQIVGYGLYNGNFTWFLLTPQAANRPPVANAGPDQSVECGTAVVLDGSKSSDPDHDALTYEWREGSTVLGTTPAISGQLSLGSHAITLTVTDPGKLSSQASVTVNVADTTAPSIVCPGAVTTPIGTNCQAVVPDFLANLSASDTCAPANQLVKSQSPPAGTLLGPGVYRVTLTATDPAGNVGSCAVTFTVADPIPPVVTCPASRLTLRADQNCQALVPNLLANLQVSDNCTPVAQLVMTQTPPAGTAVSPGVYPITVTVADAGGNVTSCNTVLTVVDRTPPVITCPASFTISADAHCQAVLPDLLARLTVSDNCTPVAQLVKRQEPAAGTVLPLGAHAVRLHVSDAAGNTSACTVHVKVVDSTPPVIASATANPSVITRTNHVMVPVTVSVVASDNCNAQPVAKIVSITSSDPTKSPGDKTGPDWQITGALTCNLRAELSANHTSRTYTITVRCSDASGNTSTKEVLVVVRGS